MILTLSVALPFPSCLRISLCFHVEKKIKADLKRLGAPGAFLYLGILVGPFFLFNGSFAVAVVVLAVVVDDNKSVQHVF